MSLERTLGRLLAPALVALVLLPPAVGAQSATVSADASVKISPELSAQMAADPARQLPLILEMQHGVTPTGGLPNADLAQRALNLIQLYGQPVGALPIVGSAAGWVNAAGIQALSQAPGVAYLHQDATVQPRRNPTPASPRATAPLASLATREVHADQVWPTTQGAGVTVAVLDSGVAADPDLGNRVLGSVSFAGQRVGSGDGGGHGTHVAGIIGGNGVRSAGEYVGIAPAANIVDVQVLDSRGNGRVSSVIGGLDWVMAHQRQYNIRVANLSFGAPAPASYHADLLSAAVEMVWRRGVVVVSAAGNGGPSRGTVESPAIDPYVISVGAVDDQATLTVADDVLAWFSAWGTQLDGGPKPDLVAPGRKVISIRVPGSQLDTLIPDHVVTASNGSTYFRLSGTSQACAVVSGAAALMLARYSGLSPDQVKAVLASTTQPYGGMNALPDPSADGGGLLDAFAAATSGPRGSANRALRPADGLARRAYPLLFGQPIVWRDPNYLGIAWGLVTWSNIAWDTIAWDNIAWDAFTWSNIAWDTIAWDNIAWDNIAWDRANWDNIAWDNIAWD